MIHLMLKKLKIPKNVYIELKTGRKYSGKVLEVEKRNGAFMITIKDKFGNNVSFYDSDISLIEQQREFKPRQNEVEHG